MEKVLSCYFQVLELSYSRPAPGCKNRACGTPLFIVQAIVRRRLQVRDAPFADDSWTKRWYHSWLCGLQQYVVTAFARGLRCEGGCKVRSSRLVGAVLILVSEASIYLSHRRGSHVNRLISLGARPAKQPSLQAGDAPGTCAGGSPGR